MRLFILFFLLITTVNAQSAFQNIEYNFEDFAELPREQIYTHINKSTFITGEYIWFKTYAISRDTKEASTQTSNIYCVLTDNDDKVISQKMIMGINGVSHGQIATDSTFKSGDYTIKTYTNWSNNFKDEYVHYQAKIKIINPLEKSFDKSLKSNKTIDVQLLPESGHFLANVNNRVGVIAKDSLGRAVSNLRVRLFKNETQISEVMLNDKGINVFDIIPDKTSDYSAKYSYGGADFIVQFPETDVRGVLLHFENKEELKLEIKTNPYTLSTIKRQPFKLTIHNSVDLISYEFNFQDNLSQQFKLSKADLFSGINIITLFDSQGKAIAERMIFNYDGLDISTIENKIINKKNDSIEIQLPFKKSINADFSSLSASVLPSETKSYNHHENLLSSILLSPYLRGAIENANYYFNDISKEKKIELDNLLLTQGWSRYDWQTIFNSPPEMTEEFEYGINYRLSSNSDKNETFLIYPNFNTKSEILEIPPNQFVEKVGFFPINDEKLRIGKREKNSSIGKSNLVVDFYPNKIPELNSTEESISTFNSNQLTNQTAYEPLTSLDKLQELDEVKIVKTKEYTRIEKLQNKTLGKIFDFDEDMKRRYRTFAQFISGHGYYVENTKGIRGENTPGIDTFIIETRNPVSINGTKEPRIFLNGAYLVDYNFLNEFSMRDVDYVEVNKGGIGEGIRAGAGVIRIYTDTNKKPPLTPKISFSEYNIPLSYNQPKQYYAPKFKSNQSQFFKEYGVIDWQPNLKVNNGFVTFKIPTQNYPIKIFIEGVVNSKSLISETIEVN